MAAIDEVRSELAEKIAEYRAAKVAPSHTTDGVTFDHDAHRANLLKEIDDLQNLIVKLGGPVVVRRQLQG